MMKPKALWILVFICYVRGGFSKTEANPNTKNLLQVGCCSYLLGLMEVDLD